MYSLRFTLLKQSIKILRALYIQNVFVAPIIQGATFAAKDSVYVLV